MTSRPSLSLTLPADLKERVSLFQSSRTQVFRFRNSQGEARILKIATASIPDSATLARYQHEGQVLQSLDSPHLVKILESGLEQGRPWLLLEDIGGRSLDVWLQHGPLPVPGVLEILIQVCRGLVSLHDSGWLHRDLNPSNLVWRLTGSRLQIIDFGLALSLKVSSVKSISPPSAVGTLAYMAPEQTGRMNRGVDVRTDLYSLGATAWHLLVGRPPFEGQDGHELIYSHLARSVPPLEDFCPEAPSKLSWLIGQLLRKEPAERLPNASVLLQELLEIQHSFASESPLDRASSQQLRPTPSFRLPEGLFGRETELEALAQSIQSPPEEAPALVFLSGPSGIGKSSLVRSFLRQAQRSAGMGRFGQVRQDLPSQALVEALRPLLIWQAGQSKQEHERFRRRLTKVLGPWMGLLLPLLPELLPFLESEVPELPLLSTQEARARLHEAWVLLLQELNQEQGPLILVLDDLQWADPEFFELLESLVLEPRLEGLLLIGCFRDQEVGLEHPLARLRSLLVELERAPLDLKLKPLELESIAELLEEACQGTLRPEQAQELGRLLQDKTAGNPFFLRSLLSQALRQEVLSWTGLAWSWEESQLRSLTPTNNVVDFLEKSLERFTEETRQLLGVAACAGGLFSLEELQAGLPEAFQDLEAVLQPALEQRLLEVFLPAANASGPEKELLQFTHDRLQEAAYQQLSPQEKSSIHWRLGEALLQEELQDSPRFFDAVGQLSRGWRQQPSSSWLDFANLCSLAGQKAEAAAAFQKAWRFFEEGLEALGPEGWETHYPLRRDLCTGAARMALATNQLDWAFSLADELLSQASSPKDAAPAWDFQAQVYLQRYEIEASLAACYAGLESLGYPVPQANPGTLLWWLLKALLEIGRRSPEELLELPKTRNPLSRPFHALHRTLALAQAAGDSRRVPLAILQSIRFVLSEGTSGLGSMCWSGLGVILRKGFGRIRLGVRYGELGIQQAQRFQDPDAEARNTFLALLLLRHWVVPFQQIYRDFEANGLLGLQVGDSITGLYSYQLADLLFWAAGRPLPLVEDRIQTQVRLFLRYRHVALHQTHSRFLDFVQALREPTPLHFPVPSSGSRYSSTLDSLVEDLLVLHQSLLSGKLRPAFELLQRPDSHRTQMGEVPTQILFWIPAAILLLLSVEQGWTTRRRIRSSLGHARRLLKSWSRHVPHRRYALDWIRATELRVRGRFRQALNAYDQGIQRAREAGLCQESALMAEHAAQLCFQAGRTRFAQTYLQEAWACYGQWGARAKQALLEQKFPELPQARSSAISHSSGSASGENLADKLDLRALMQGARILSGERQAPELSQRILQILMENAGADSGALVFQTPSGLRILALSGENDPVPPEGLPLSQCPGLPITLLRYVVRSGRRVLVEDAANDLNFSVELLALPHPPRSALCAPLLHSGKVLGSIYLENRLSSHCFTPERVETVQLLASQAAISMENARFYEDLESRVEQRTRELAEARKSAEEAREVAEEASQAKSRFLAHMSHELRTPLNVILGGAQLLLDKPDFKTQDRDSLQAIQRSGRHLQAVIEDVLDLAKGQAGRLELRPTAVDLPLLLQEVAGFLVLQAQSKGLELCLELDPELPRQVEADPLRLRQVLLNLVGNAVKFTENGKVVLSCVKTSEQWKANSSNTGSAEFSAEDLSDSGYGPVAPVASALVAPQSMAKLLAETEKQQRMTQPFALSSPGLESPIALQAFPDRRSKQPGTQNSKKPLGLGLLMCHSLLFSVSDTGIGIPTDQLNSIFRPFEQAGDETTRSKGTGLGLSLSQGLVQLMGGQIQVESTPGQGSRFWFQLEFAQILGEGPSSPIPSGEPRYLPGIKSMEGGSFLQDSEGQASLPREILEHYLSLVEEGELPALQMELASLKQKKPFFSAALRHLEKLALDYDDEALLKLISQGLGS